MNYCRVIIVGNVAQDPNLKYIGENKTPCAEYSVAYSYRLKREGEWDSEPAFIDCRTYGPQAERVSDQFRKGDAVFVEGRLRMNTWKDTATGSKRSKLVLTTDLVLMPSGRGKPEDTSPKKHVPPAPQQHSAVDESDIPF